MIFRKTYHFRFPMSKELLTQSLKDLSETDLVIPHTWTDNDVYTLQFNWNEFIVTSSAKMFKRQTLEINAHIRLISQPDNQTQIEVTIKYSGITWLLLIFFQLMIFGVSIFGNDFNWLARIALFTGSTVFLGFILWLGFIQEENKIKQVISGLFERIEI